MRDILISSAVFVTCLIVALASQIVSPSSAVANPEDSAFQAEVRTIGELSTSSQPIELDPEETNPLLFTMATENSQTNASQLGGSIEAGNARLTESGLSITDLIEGDGPEAQPGKTVKVHYRGTLDNGKEFDSSYQRGPFSFPLGAGRVIKGWDEGVKGMKVNGKRKLVIPPELGYGSRGAGGVIPPDAILIFEVELLEVS